MIPTTFAQPLWFGLLPVPILLGIWELIRRPHTLVLPFDHGGQSGTMAGSLAARRFAVAASAPRHRHRPARGPAAHG